MVKTVAKNMKNFDETVEVFGNPEKFQNQINYYKEVTEKAQKTVEMAGKVDDINFAHGNIAALERSAEAKHELAKQAYSNAKAGAAGLAEEAHAKVLGINEESAKRERVVSEREIAVGKRDARVSSAVDSNNKILAEILSKTSDLEGKLAAAWRDVDGMRTVLAEKLLKVNKLLGE